MKEFLSIILNVLVSPSKITRKVITRKPTMSALVILGLVALSATVFSELTAQSRLELAPMKLVGQVVMRFVFSAMVLFIGAGVLHLVADLLGGGGSGASLLLLLYIGAAPALLLAPGALALHYAGQLAPPLTPLVFKAVIGIWIIILDWIFIREIYRFSLSKALLVLLLPCLVLGLLGATMMAKALFAYPAVPIL